MHTIKSFIALFGFLLIVPQVEAQMVINEIMQSNIDCMMDDLNEFPDSWVELYNADRNAQNLKNFKLGLTRHADEAWQLPTQQIGPRRHVVIYCDKESKGFHTDFRLESGNEGYLYLFKDGEIVDSIVNLSKQPAPNTAYGRLTDGASEWGYQSSPTPNASNCGTFALGTLEEPVFSEKGRVVTGSQRIRLELSLPENSPEGTVIRMTTDGSEPTASSPLYTAPINIYSNKVIRAKLFCEGYLSPPSTTHSYLFFPRSFTLPVVSIVTDKLYYYGSKVGIYIEGSYSNNKKNYEYNWRRPINIEYFENEGAESDINQLCETRIQGAASRGCQLKSQIVYAHKRFGKKRLKYEFFPDQRPGIDNFKSIILRNAGNDFDYLYMRDAIIQRVMAQHTDLDWQAWRPAVVYFNGEYKGILNIRERSTGDNIFTNYDGLEDIDMVENNYQLKEGDMKNWEQFQVFYNEHGHTLEEYAQWIDWKEYINLMVMNLYFNNQDFPGNNIVVWRPRAEGGIWRFVAKDTDFGIGLYDSPANYNTIKWLYTPDYDYDRNWANGYEATRLFRRMMEDDDFSREFIDRSAIYMGDFLNEKGIRKIWDPMYETIRKEYPNHRNLINQWWPNYSNELNKGRQWVKERTGYFYSQLADYYHLGTPISMQINNDVDENDLKAVDILFNGVKLSESRFDGKFFEGRSINLTSVPVNGRQITGWRVISAGPTTSTQIIDGSSLNIMMPSCQKLLITAIYGNHDGIDEKEENRLRWSLSDCQLTISGVASGTLITIYDLQGILVFQEYSKGCQTMVNLPRKAIYIMKVGDATVKIK